MDCTELIHLAFNTPYGKYKSPNIVNEVTIRALSITLMQI